MRGLFEGLTARTLRRVSIALDVEDERVHVKVKVSFSLSLKSYGAFHLASYTHFLNTAAVDGRTQANTGAERFISVRLGMRKVANVTLICHSSTRPPS